MPDTLTQLTPEQLANRENFTRKLHLRSVSVDLDKGEFTGIAVPYGESVDIPYLWKERFERNAVEDSDDAKVFWDHQEVIGRLVANRNVDGGWEVTGKVSRTQRGQDTLTLLADEAVDGLSVHFDPIEHRVEEDGTVVFTRVRIREVSVTPFPQYNQARVKYLRNNTTNQEETPMTESAPETAPGGVATLTREDVEQVVAESTGELQRSLDARLATFGSRPQQDAPLLWRSAGELLKAIANGDQAATDFHTNWNDRSAAGDAFRRAYTGSSTADGPDRNTWVGDAIRLVDKQRKVINRFQRKPLPAEGMTLEYAKISSNTVDVTKQAAQGDDLALGKVVVDTATADVETYGGYSEMSLQQVKRSPVDVVNTTNQAQQLKYAQATEAAVRSYLVTQIAAQITAGNKVDVATAPDLFGYLDAIVDAAELFEDRGFTIDGAYVSKATFKLLLRLADSSDRMVMNVWGSGQNLAGEISVKGLKGDLANVRIELLAGAATKTFCFYDELALTTWEEPGAPLKLQDENVINLSKQFSVHGSIAYGLQYPTAILPLKYAAS